MYVTRTECFVWQQIENLGIPYYYFYRCICFPPYISRWLNFLWSAGNVKEKYKIIGNLLQCLDDLC